MTQQRDFDYVVYGASGYTGQYVVEKLATQLKDKPSVKWAVAGRSATKVERCMAECGKRIGALLRVCLRAFLLCRHEPLGDSCARCRQF